MRSVVVFAVAALAAVAFAAEAVTDLSFKAGVNLTGASSDFAFRYTNAIHIPIVDVLAWTSLSVDADTKDASARAKADALVGAGVLPTALSPPISVLAYGSGDAALSLDVSQLMTNALTGDLGVKVELTAVAMAAFGMQEYTPDNKPVEGKPFIPFFGSLLSGKDITADDGNVTGMYSTFKAGGADVTVSYITSKKAGILKYGNTPVSPRTFETVIEVKNFPLSDSKNHVRMDIGFLSAHAAASVDAHGSAAVKTKDGKTSVYVAAAPVAVVDDKSVSVNVDMDAKAESDTVGGAALNALKAFLNADFDYNVAHINFPAGAKSFVYDPVVGSGSNIYNAEGASTVALSLLVALVCVLVYLF